MQVGNRCEGLIGTQKAQEGTKESVNAQFPIRNSHRMRIGNWELSINGFFCASCAFCVPALFSFLKLYQQRLAQAAGNRLVSNRDGGVRIYRTTPDVIADGRRITDELNFLRLG